MGTGLVLALDLGKHKSVAVDTLRRWQPPTCHSVPLSHESLVGLLERNWRTLRLTLNAAFVQALRYGK